MSDLSQIDLSDAERSAVLAILDRCVPDGAVWVYGSRANGSAQRYSDLDLAVISDTPLSAAVRSGLAEAFSESDLPWRVDILDWATASPEFRAIVARNKIVLREGRSSAASTL